MAKVNLDALIPREGLEIIEQNNTIITDLTNHQNPSLSK